MANVIRIKRSTTQDTPTSLEQGELAYSETSDNLFIGISSDSLEKIGGQADVSKLAGIEASATIDQTDAEIRTAVEAASDSNVFTDSDHSKLNAIEASATADQTNAQIRTAVEAASNSNVFTDADHTKLGGIATSANNYSLPTSSSSVLGGVKVGANLSITGGVLAAESSYSHPTHPGDDFSLDTTALTGATVISDIDINVTTDTLGHVTDANGTVSTRTLTLANLGYTGATNANNYSLPTATSSVLGGVKNGTGISNSSGVLSVSTAYLADSHDASGVTSTKITNWDTSYSWYTLMNASDDSNSIVSTVAEMITLFDSTAETLDLMTALNAKMDDGQTIDGGTF